ncbi:CSLREA domain-containing protein [Acinetobacter calcoaceticus]|uniref:CSLREA domain-containing protein n=1 Tax=Acinetobacter calcoaceticus TaxID=471 RepID=A0A4R1XSG9_ACICA|nr:CSLREA domain-containing protein [Acinetobacter calcoaceticus]
MKNKKKLLLTVSILMTMPLMAAKYQDPVIEVTTLDDEDGENSNKCSLREAVTTASLKKSYGGCEFPRVYTNQVLDIKLEKGEYKLNRELVPTVEVRILGKEPIDYSKKNVLTNKHPALTAVQSKIIAQGKHRIINTSKLNRPTLSLKDLDLYNGYSDENGGSILVGGALVMNNVSIYNSQAKMGGAIYINNYGGAVIIGNGTFRNNQAAQGSVMAMTCTDNLVYTKRSISLENLSILENGSSDSNSVIAYCGEPTAIISTSTIAKNKANLNTGSIIQFSPNTPTGKVALGMYSSLQMLSNTIVENAAYSTFLYDDLGNKTLGYNIIGFNGIGKSCRYAKGNIADVEQAGIRFDWNAMGIKAGNDSCDIPSKQIESVTKESIDLTGKNIASLLNPLSTQELTEYTAFMPMYFFNMMAKDNPLVDTGGLGCSSADQRGINRLKTNNSVASDQKENSCDIGSTEVLRLTAFNVSGANESMTIRLKYYKDQLEVYKKLVDEPKTNQDFIPFYKSQIELFENLLKYTKERQKYRTIYTDVFEQGLPDELVSANGVREVRHLNLENYDVRVKSLGVGKFDSDEKFQGREDKNLKCVWDADLKQVMMYRLDDRITPSGDFEFCEYSLSSKKPAPANTSTAYIIGSFVNVAPEAKKASFEIRYGEAQKLQVDLLPLTNDDGDGDVSQLSTKSNKSSYYVDAQGKDLAIRFTTLRDPVSVSAERTGPCPGADAKETCYGGAISLQLKNTFDPASYTLKYAVYDMDGAISNNADIELKNKGFGPGTTPTGGSSGGGSVGIGVLMGLLGLVAWRRYRR